jgi:predicted peptidase
LAYHGGGAQARTRELGDMDVMHVMESVAAEYGVDRSRIYMIGNSAGAGRTWTLASQYGEKLAGLAPCASGASLKNMSFEKLKNMPVLACVGELDTDNRKEVARFGIAKVKEISAHAEYVEVPGGTHGTAIQIAMPQIFEFFNHYTRAP